VGQRSFAPLNFEIPFLAVLFSLYFSGSCGELTGKFKEEALEKP
jgi:hypothetical protein